MMLTKKDYQMRRKLSSETMRLNQEIERHRHITATTSRYPSEMRARSYNAVLDFNLNNEINQITKQMKHFEVAFDRQHKGTFQAVSSRRRSSLQAKSLNKSTIITNNTKNIGHLHSPIEQADLKKKNTTSSRSRVSKSTSPRRFLPEVQQQDAWRQNNCSLQPRAQTSLQKTRHVQQINRSTISGLITNDKQLYSDEPKMSRALSLDQRAAQRRFSSSLAATIDKNNVRILAKRRLSACLPSTSSS